MVESFLKIVITKKIIKQIAFAYNDKWQERERAMKGRYLNLKISQVWRKRVRRWGGSKEKMHEMTGVRGALVGGLFMIDSYE